MLVRQKDGYYAGEVREFPSHIGLELIRSGRGIHPFLDAEEDSAPKTREVTAGKGVSTKVAARRGKVR